MWDLRLKGKVAIITGAGSGIGRAAAIAFAKEGAKIVIAGRRLEPLNETVRLVKEVDGEALPVMADVSKAQDAEKIVAESVKTFGRLDVLYNNAGMDASGSIIDVEEDLWDFTINVNLKGTFLCSKYAVPEIKRQRGGSIINTASILGLLGLPDYVAYCTAKGGVINLTRAMVCDCGPIGIRVNCICPGAICTPIMEDYFKSSGDPERLRGFFKKLYPIGRLGTPEDVANVAVFLASDESSFVNGAVVVVDGGITAQNPEAHWPKFW